MSLQTIFEGDANSTPLVACDTIPHIIFGQGPAVATVLNPSLEIQLGNTGNIALPPAVSVDNAVFALGDVYLVSYCLRMQQTTAAIEAEFQILFDEGGQADVPYSIHNTPSSLGVYIITGEYKLIITAQGVGTNKSIKFTQIGGIAPNTAQFFAGSTVIMRKIV